MPSPRTTATAIARSGVPQRRAARDAEHVVVREADDRARLDGVEASRERRVARRQPPKHEQCREARPRTLSAAAAPRRGAWLRSTSSKSSS